MGGARRRLWTLLAIVLSLPALFLLSLALPVEAWRTGRLPVPRLPVEAGGPGVELPSRVWIDTDAACGTGARNDPDDCFALLLLLARAPGIGVVGVSTVFGNAPLESTDATARGLLERLRAMGVEVPPVHAGAAVPLEPGRPPRGSAGAEALRRALAEGPLTIVALGPLTNVAAALRGPGSLGSHRLVTVMGRRPGHLFHPAEGEGDGVLFGHGPVFTDFNFAQDPEAARLALGTDIPVTLVPYDAGRSIIVTAEDLARLDAAEGAGWVARRSRGWLEFWREAVGIGGFHPFDLAAAAYVAEVSSLDCARAHASVARDELLWGFPRHPPALLVGPDPAPGTRPVVYCTGARPGLSSDLMRRLAGVGRSGRVPDRREPAF